MHGKKCRQDMLRNNELAARRKSTILATELAYHLAGILLQQELDLP